jgi:hypothetical protein
MEPFKDISLLVARWSVERTYQPQIELAVWQLTLATGRL